MYAVKAGPQNTSQLKAATEELSPPQSSNRISKDFFTQSYPQLAVGLESDGTGKNSNVISGTPVPQETFVQRKCAECAEEEEQVHRKPLPGFAINHTAANTIQRQPAKGPLTTYNKGVADRAKARLKVLEPQLAALEGRQIEIEAEQLRTIADRDYLDANSSDPFMEQRRGAEADVMSKLNTAPVDIVVSGNAVVFNVKFHVKFEDPAMNTRFEELKANVQAGIDLVWKQNLGGVFAGRTFTIMPTFTLIDATTARDLSHWLIVVRKVSTGAKVVYPGCTLDQPDPAVPTSVTDAMCDGGVMSIPPSHINRPGILGHEMLHLFGLLDRYMMMTSVVPGKKPVVGLSPTRDTHGRPDPLGAQDGTILTEDLGYLFKELGVYSMEEARSTAGLGSIKREVMRQQEIARLGYDPNSLIPSIIRRDFTDKMIKDAENL